MQFYVVLILSIMEIPGMLIWLEQESNITAFANYFTGIQVESKDNKLPCCNALDSDLLWSLELTTISQPPDKVPTATNYNLLSPIKESPFYNSHFQLPE